MFQTLTQGSTVPVFYKNIPRVVDGRVVSVNTHMPVYNPQQPMAMLNGPVTDITVQIDNDTIPFAGLPANGVVANFPDRGLFLSTDRSAILREIDTMVSAFEQDLSAVPAKQESLARLKALQLEQNPEMKKEAEQAQEITSLRSEMSQMRSLLQALLEQNKKEN